MKNLNTHARGFTLIELVIVIVILGILAAVALPRFINTQRDARVAKTNALFGSIRVAAKLAKVRCELDLSQNLTAAGTCGNAAPQVNMDGTIVSIVNRYPAASTAGIVAASGVNATSDGMTIATTGSVTTFRTGGATTPATCLISYTAAAANAEPLITVNTAGC